MPPIHVWPEDLMDLVVAADNLQRQRRGDAPFLHPQWKRQWIEPPFNIVGTILGQGLAMLPWPLRWRADQKITVALGANPSAAPRELAPRLGEISDLTQRLHRETGQRPAALILTSHPATTGALQWLRFELVREGLLLGNAVVEMTQPGRWYPRAPQCFLATDPYALDTVRTPVGALYTGFMNRIYLIWDRQIRTQSSLQKYLLMPRTGYRHIAARLVRSLRQGSPVVMVLPGGLPQNARLLYTAREFVLQLPVERWPYPKRVAQKKWMECVMTPVNGVLPIEQGTLPGKTRQDLGALLTEWGIPELAQARWLDAFAAEFKGEVPYRTRLFRMLFHRIVAKGCPLLWIAVAHRKEEPHVHISVPWGAYQAGPGEFRLIRGSGNPERIPSLAELAVDFSKQFLV